MQGCGVFIFPDTISFFMISFHVEVYTNVFFAHPMIIVKKVRKSNSILFGCKGWFH